MNNKKHWTFGDDDMINNIKQINTDNYNVNYNDNYNDNYGWSLETKTRPTTRAAPKGFRTIIIRGHRTPNGLKLFTGLQSKPIRKGDEGNNASIFVPTNVIDFIDANRIYYYPTWNGLAMEEKNIARILLALK